MKRSTDRTGGVSRRGFLVGAGALLSGAALEAQRRAAGTGAAPVPVPTRVVDVHHHFLPPFYLKALEGRMNGSADVTGWSAARSLAMMDRNGITTAMMSISNPGVEAPAPSDTPKLCRDCNDFGAKLVVDYPKRFGLFASLPLPDVDASLKEIGYALDTLHADGIGLMSHYGDATYLGDAKLEPVFAELNRRKVVAFIHPASPFYAPAGTLARGKYPSLPGFAAPDLIFDTTRAVGYMLQQGWPEKYPDIRFILPHAGGTMAMLITRGAVLSGREVGLEPTYSKLIKAMSGYYYDLTNTMATGPIKLVLSMASPSKLIFGTDYPYAGHFTHEILERVPHVGLTAPQVAALARGNIESLFPRLKSQLS